MANTIHPPNNMECPVHIADRYPSYALSRDISSCLARATETKNTGLTPVHLSLCSGILAHDIRRLDVWERGMQMALGPFPFLFYLLVSLGYMQEPCDKFLKLNGKGSVLHPMKRKISRTPKRQRAGIFCKRLCSSTILEFVNREPSFEFGWSGIEQ